MYYHVATCQTIQAAERLLKAMSMQYGYIFRMRERDRDFVIEAENDYIAGQSVFQAYATGFIDAIKL